MHVKPRSVKKNNYISKEVKQALKTTTESMKLLAIYIVF